MVDRKLVLITGAGFSATAGLPIQSRVLRQIMDFSPKVGLVGRRDFYHARDRVKAFLNAVFLNGGESKEIRAEDLHRLEQLTLEDVYTILDKAITRRDWLTYHNWSALAEVRQSLDLCVCQYLTSCQESYSGPEYDNAVKQLNELFGERWATITLNWDTIWDRTLLKALENLGKVPDFGCPPLWLSHEDYQVVQQPLDRLGVPLLKLHGSFNWVSCPRCRTLFVGKGDLGKFGHLDQFFCPLCVPGGQGPTGPSLQPLFLTPTIMKTFENPSLNMVWDRALHVLANATDVVFIGYSFPLADHDLRYLLRKAIPGRARVKVVLHESDAPTDARLHGLLPQARYQAFFGLENDAFFYGGWQKFFESDLS